MYRSSLSLTIEDFDSPVTITLEDYEELSAEYGGACLACGDFSYGVEPDARGYMCPTCGAAAVFGADELLVSGAVV